MKKLRNLLITTVTALLLILPVGVANAATAGRTCYLSPNWPVYFSATWYGSSLDYMVMRSPGLMNYYGTYASFGKTSSGIVRYFYFDHDQSNGDHVYVAKFGFISSSAIGVGYGGWDSSTGKPAKCSVTIPRP